MSDIFSRLEGTLKSFFRILTVVLKDASGVLQIRNSSDTAFTRVDASQFKVMGTNASNGILLNAPNSLGANVTLTLPGATGASGQALMSDGAGTLYFGNVSSDAQKTEIIEFTQASASPLTLLSPPDDATLLQVRVRVESAAAGGNPTIAIGISGQTSKYVTTTESDLKQAKTYIIDMFEALGTSPADIIATIDPNAQSFTGQIIIVYAI